MRNKGVVKQGADNRSLFELKEFQYLSDRYFNIGQWLAQRLIDYLQANSELYLTYHECICSDKIKPQKAKFSSGMYISSLLNGKEDNN